MVAAKDSDGPTSEIPGTLPELMEIDHQSAERIALSGKLRIPGKEHIVFAGNFQEATVCQVKPAEFHALHCLAS